MAHCFCDGMLDTSEILFFPSLTRLANDVSSKVHSKVVVDIVLIKDFSRRVALQILPLHSRLLVIQWYRQT